MGEFSRLTIEQGAIRLILEAVLSMQGRTPPLVVVPVDLTYDRIVEDMAFVRDRMIWLQFKQNRLSTQELTAWSRRSKADTLRELGLFLVSRAELGELCVSCLSPLTVTFLETAGMSPPELSRYTTEQCKNIVRHCDRQWHQLSHVGNTGLLALVIGSISPTWVKAVKLADVRKAYAFWQNLLQRHHPDLHLKAFEDCLEIVRRTEVVRLGSSEEIAFDCEDDFNRLSIYLHKSLPIVRFLREVEFSAEPFAPNQQLLIDNLKSFF